MIKVTVKTLDSHNHEFSVPDDISVKGFKQHISSSVFIDPHKQRLIYCGRVLQDEKKLSEYNVHEKVIHLVMRAPPQANSRPEGRGASSTGGDGPHPRHRGSHSHSQSNADGHQVVFGSFVLPEDAFESLTTTQGSSSSGVRLNQAKTMLDKASAIVDLLDSHLGYNTSQESSTSTSDEASASTSSFDAEPMESASSEPEQKDQTKDHDSQSVNSQPEKKAKISEGNQDPSQPTLPTEEIEALYSEMDALNSMDPAMLGGGQFVGNPMGNPLMGAINTSLAGGLAQAASAAVASALSSLSGTTPSTSTASTSVSSSSSSSTSTSTSSSSSSSTPSTAPAPPPPSGPFIFQSGSRQRPNPLSGLFQPTSVTFSSRSPHSSRFAMGSSRPTPPTPAQNASAVPSSSPSSGTSTPTTTSSASESRNASSTSSQPQGSVRGFTVRITNRGPSQRSSGMQLEHPRCSVMVEVLDQYHGVQRRLRPYMDAFYQSMVDDRRYQGSDDRQLQIDQWVVWRVSEAMHFISHAMHAISDIIVDLRRTPPRQLRARPIIIPQPALVQAQINVTAGADPNQPRTTSTPSTTTSSATTAISTAGASAMTTGTTSDSSPSSASTSNGNGAMLIGNSLPIILGNPGLGPGAMSNLPPEFSADHDGMVVMRVGPNSITVDSLSPDGASADGLNNGPPELIQNIMTSIASHFGMRIGEREAGGAASSTANSSAVSSAQSSQNANGDRTPVHNSQAGGNSGTNTTNSTQTRVTHRPHVHVTPFHVPGMGMSQFDPFLPCQSHHIRSPTVARNQRRRRHRTTFLARPDDSQSENSENAPTSRPARETRSETRSRGSSTANTSTAQNSSGDFLQEIFSSLQEVFDGMPAQQDNENSEEQEQQQLFSQILQHLMTEVSGFTRGGSSGMDGVEESSNSQQGSSRPRQRATVQDFLQPFCGTNLFSSSERESIFVQLVLTVAETLSMEDLIHLFFGDSRRLNILAEPLMQFTREHVLGGSEPTEENINRAIDRMFADLQPHLDAAAEDATYRGGLDYVNSLTNFIRHRLRDIIQIFLNHSTPETFGSTLVARLRLCLEEFIAITVRCLADGERGLERLVEGRLHSIMSGVSPSIQNWSVSTSILQLRSIMSQISVNDVAISHFLTSSEDSTRAQEPMPQTSSAAVSAETTPKVEPATEPKEKPEPKNKDDDYSVESMEIDDEVAPVVEVSATPPEENNGNAEAVIVDSPQWHNSVPQDWIPVITRDVERQRRSVPDTNLSDAYLRGMPLKRRKLSQQNKPRGSVQQVMQENLQQSLRAAGVNTPLVDSLSRETSGQLADSFAGHVRSVLRDQLDENKDFQPEKFPKTEQKIRK